MSVNISKYLAALLLILSVIVISSSFVNANCYVISSGCYETNPPPTGCGQTDITQKNCLNLTSVDYDPGTCFSYTDPSLGETSKCVTGCCCVNAGPNQGMTYNLGVTRGICEATNNNNVWYSGVTASSDCENKCNNVQPGATYGLTVNVTIGGAPAPGVTLTLTDSNNQWIDTTDINGLHTFLNMNQTTYSLTAVSGTCSQTQTVTLDATKQVNIALNCPNVKVSGYIFMNNNLFYPATVNASYSGSTESMITTNGYYEFTVPYNSVVTLAAIDNLDPTCIGGNGKTITSDTTLNVTLFCQRYNVNITILDDNSQYITDAAVKLEAKTQNNAAEDGLADNIYAFTNLADGIQTATASKTLSPQGNSILDCSNSVQIDLTGANANQQKTIVLDKNSCCNTTTTLSSSCVNNFKQKTVIYTGTCAKNPVITNVPCNQSISIACEWNCSGWNPATCQLGDFQRIKTCSGKIIANNCNPALPTPMPTLISSCTDNCGDGILNTTAGEQCDYSVTGNVFNATSQCIDDWNKTDPQHLISVPYIQSMGFSFVSQVCNLGTCQCIPTNTNVVIPLIPACVQDITNDKIGSISSFNVSHVYAQHAFNLAWYKTPTCQDYIDHFKLEVCNNDTGQCALGYNLLADNMPKGNTAFYHNGTIGSPYPIIISNTTYCYRLTTIFNGSISPDKTIVTIACKKSGDEPCLTTHSTSWCGGTAGKDIDYCSAENTLKTNSTCNSTQTCQNNNGVASCIDQSECDLCNGILGLFGYQGYTITRVNAKTIFCPSLSNPHPTSTNTGLSSNSYSFGCYMDFSRTSVDKAYKCNDVTSCYDYTSEDACTVDYCSKFRQAGANVDGCKWNPYSYEGGRNIFGRGVCSPANISNQQCELCTDKAYNNMGLCTGEICRLYGDCYYSYSTYSCINKADVTCNSYGTSYECTNGVNVNTNVTWSDLEVNNGVKVSGNNIITSRSKDDAGLGVCRWLWNDPNDQTIPSSGSCFRDADNMFTGLNYPWPDCRINTGDPAQSNALMLNCEHDITPPTTSIATTGTPTYGLKMDLHDKVLIKDDNQWPIGDSSLCSNNGLSNECHYITTQYCIMPTGTGCYPNNTLRVTPDGNGGEYTIDLTSFSHLSGQLNDGASLTMYYFSEDPARNLESLKSLPFTLDAIKPNVAVGLNMNSYQLGPSQWRTNVSVTLTLQPAVASGKPETSVPVTCSFKVIPTTDAAALTFNLGSPNRTIFNIPSIINPNNKLQSNGATLQTMYPGLSEGKYMYQLYCVDSANNDYNATDNFTVIGDARIFSPYPDGSVNVSSDYLNPATGQLAITISVMTNTTGNCRYSETPNTNYATMTPFTTTGGTTHSTIVTMPPTDASGIHKYFVACMLNVNGALGAPQVVYASEGAYPYFIIDDIPPVTDILYANPNNNWNWTKYDDSVNAAEFLKIKLVCNSDNPLFVTGNTNAAFQCNNTYYCIEEPGINKLCTDQFNMNDYKLIGSTEELIFNYHGINISNKTRYGNNPKIHFYSTDIGKNIASPTETDLRVKNLQLKPPVVKINGINASNPGSNTGNVNINSSYLTITVHYDEETNVNIDGTDLRHANTSVALDKPSGTNGGVDYTFTRSYIDNGDYTLIIPGTDDDSNTNNFSASIHVTHSNNAVRLVSPPVGIGSKSPYDITVATDYYSNCRYGTSALEACPDKYCIYNYASVYTDFDMTGSGSLYHTFSYYGSNDTMYVICKTLNTLDETSNNAYVTTSFHVGYDSTIPNIIVQFIQNPRTGPYDNKIINSSYSAITVQLITDIPSVCTINATFPGRSLIDITPPQMFKGESFTNYDSYSTNHTYLINYSGRGITNSELFEYTVNCTSRGELSTTKNVEINFTPFTPAPVMNIALFGEPTLTFNQYSVSCAGLCMNPYTYAYSYVITNQTVDCNSSTLITSYTLVNYSFLIPVKKSSRICVKSYDILGRLSMTQKDVNMFDFNNGLMNINYPYSYYYTSGNKTHVYSPIQDFTFDITTLSDINVPVNATCKAFMTKDVLAYIAAHPNNSTPLYKIVFENMSGGLFDHTSTSTSKVSEHTTAFHITATQNIMEPWSIVCNITNLGPGDDSYISRELFFYWDDSAPVVSSIVIPSRIYDWSDSSGVTLNVATDDDSMCILNLSKSTITIRNGSYITTQTLDYTKTFVMLDTNGQDINAEQMFNNYGKNRSRYYSLSDIPSQWLALSVDATYNFNINCWNRARLYNSNNTTMLYNLDSQVTINRTSGNVFNSSIMPIRLTTNIMSDCTAIIDSDVPMILSSSDDINHSADISISGSGFHTVNITCAVPANSNIIAAHDDYVTMIDTAPPVIENLSSTTGQDYTCGLNGFKINIDMSDDTGIAGYNYMIFGPNNITQLLNVSTSSNHDVIIYSNTLQDGGVYTVNVKARDLVGRFSASKSISITARIPGSSILCDNNLPTLNVGLATTPFMDMIKATVSCTDDTGCRDIFYYSFTNKSTCNNVSYSSTGAYNSSLPAFMNDGILCVEGQDLAGNWGYAQQNITIGIDMSNPLNITIIPSPPDTDYVSPNVLIARVTPVNISLTTAFAATCKYSLTPNTIETDLSKLYDAYMPFTQTDSTNHILTGIDMQGYEKDIDVICYTTLLSPSQAYSRKVIRIIYSTDPATIDASVVPNYINDWNNRKSILTINTAPETVCTITSRGDQGNNDVQNFAVPYDTGNYSNALTYTTTHKKELMYDSYDLSYRNFTYLIICKTLGGNISNTLIGVAYNISNNLIISLMSPTTYNNRTIEILIQTNVISHCSMKWNGVSKGSMLANVTNLQHYIKINTSADGLYTAEFDCSAPITGLETMANYSIRINTTQPAPVCGDGIVQKPSEECDGADLYGNTCTFGFTGYNYTGGILQCNAPGTPNACKYNFSTCDLGKGWCGDGNIEGPNSQGIYEQCDNVNIPTGLSCASFGFKLGGTLSCNKACVINTSRCIQENIGVQGVLGAQTCSNHMLESGEQCEADGNNTINCTSFGYYAGTVSCNSCMYNMIGCYFNIIVQPSPGGAYCGNNVRDYNEQCDGTSLLSNATCKALGNFTSGNVSCTKNCTFNLSKCVNNASSSTCYNDIKDSGETDLNCGGSCGTCALNKTCVVNSDCASGKCSDTTNRCIMNPCNNSIFDSATETDVDCGKSCSPCADNKKCFADTDCKSGYCIDNICSGDPCSDGLLSAGESDVDCGGSCSLCELDKKCNSNSDCSTDYCDKGVCAEVPPPTNPLKIPLLIIGIVFILGGGGYIAYKTFFVEKSSGRNGGFNQGGMMSGPNGMPPDMTPKPMKLSPEMIARQREAMIKKRQVRAEERKGMIGKLDDTSASSDTKKIAKDDDKSKKTEKDDSDKNDKNKGNKTDEFVELSTINDSKDKELETKASKEKNKKDTFSKLKEIGKGQSKAFDKLKELKPLKTDDVAKKIAQISGTSTDNVKPKLSNTESFTDKDALELFGEMDRTTLMSGVFTDVLSQLLTSGKITKDNVSKILFEYMDKGLLNKGDVAKINSDLKLI